MQTAAWYLRRLRIMTPQEIAWRMQCALQNTADRCLIGLRQRPQPSAAILHSDDGEDAPSFHVTDIPVGAWAFEGARGPERHSLAPLVAQADRIAAHQISFFDLEDCDLGNPIDWNRDHKSGKAAPMRFAPWIDYRDFSVTGDCKFVWEPNRHHQLVVLGRAYRATGDQRYAAAAVEQLRSWLDQCPFGIGMNWRSPLELGIRLINWVWTVDLIRESGLVHGEFRERFLGGVYRHVWEIARKYSRSSSVNNHLIGEAAGVFIVTSYLHNLKNAERWRAQSRHILANEILNQTFPGGGTREQALGYHLFVLQFFLIAGIVARKIGEDFPAAYWARLEKMLEFAGAMTEGGAPPMFGDCDDGYVLDLGGERGDFRPWLAVGAVLFGRPDFKVWAGGSSEPALWLLGGEGLGKLNAIPNAGQSTCLASRAFPDSGYYLLQYRGNRAEDRVSVGFDCGPLGMGPLAAHGHADALSLTLRAFGQDVLVDPGTYDYFSFPRWREYFRSTRAHNTVVIDGQDQSMMAGSFMWSEKAESRCTRWEPRDAGGAVAGEHDGYTRLADPVTHRRSLDLDGPGGILLIRDDIVARGRHDVEVFFHLAEDCRVTRMEERRCDIDVGPGNVTIEFDPRLSIQLLVGSENPVGGWVSRGYHRKSPSTTLIGRCVFDGNLSLVHRVGIRRCQPT